jgi:hypothetical protein
MRIGVVAVALMSTWHAGSAAQLPSPSCILLPAASQNATTGSRGRGSTSYTCVFDASAVTVTCTNAGGMMRVTAVTKYPSKNDLVDTVSAIPPLVRSESLTLTAPGSTTSTAYTYDRQKRLTREVATAAMGVTVTTDYSDWDAHGRPLKARITTSPAGRAPSDQAIKYDDAARTKTITTTQNGTVSTDVVTFDENGNQIKATGSDARSSYTSTTTISSTTKVCR